MPVNNNLKSKTFPFPIKFGQGGKTEYKNNLEAIDVRLTQAPFYEDIRDSCIAFANATWKDEPMSNKDIRTTIPEPVRDKFMSHIFGYKILPTTMETIRVTFMLKGITLQEVTHILRYRRAVFSAECSGDKFMNDKGFSVPTAIENSDEFYERYKKICDDAKKLYLDMVDSKKVSTHDARYIFPRSLETYYYMSMSLKDALLFIYDRVDKQIQPQSDNVLAYLMMKELVKQYPILALTLNENYIHRPADFYIKTARQCRSTNWFCPDADSDKFEYNENDFVYGLQQRDKILGVDRPERDVFTKIQKETAEFLKERREMIEVIYPNGYLTSDFKEEELAYFNDLA